MIDGRKLSDEACKLIGSFTLFKKIFYEELTRRPYVITLPVSREARQTTIARELTKVKRLETLYLDINICPGSGKSTELALFVAWCYAEYPDCNHMYIGNGYSLAEHHTHTVKRILQLPLYRNLFQIELRKDSNAKGAFTTNYGGRMAAFGSYGDIVGFDAGIPHVNRYSGAIFIDDIHKPQDIHSDVMREGVIRNYQQSILSRRRSPLVPIVGIGQRLHEEDWHSFIENGNDGYPWKFVKLPTLDEHGNNLCPDVISKENLLLMRDMDPYTFYSQHQQTPTPAGGGIFRSDGFIKLPFDPEVLCTFITADTAETDKSWNDATVFSFWGVYKIVHEGFDTDMYGLHWIDCVEVRIEPKDLQSTFMSFYSNCMRYKCKPKLAAIEKKSTGVTLCSVLSNFPGLQILEIERTSASGSKAKRFYDVQPYIASKRVTFTEGARHFDMCVKHMGKITANNTHAHDDIADTCADAIYLALIDNVVYTDHNVSSKTLSYYDQFVASKVDSYLSMTR